MTKKATKPKTHAKIRKEHDLETRIRTRRVLGDEYFEIRDYVPSTGNESRGWTGPMHLLPQVIESLTDLHERTRTDQAAQIPGQQELPV